MNTSEILAVCNNYKEAFQQTLVNETYQYRGAFNSEILLLVALTKHFECHHFIESGRARGHSTNLIAKFFDADARFTITSIDLDHTSKDALFSEKYLSRYSNVTLLYGNSVAVIPKVITDRSIVFIDGPKGDEAIELAIQLLRDPRIKVVGIHDLHKNTFHRNICEAIFSNSFFSDDVAFVEQFADLDTQCWEVLKGTGEAPYQRNGKPIASYASTLGIFFNSDTPLREPACTNYQAYLRQHRPTFATAFLSSPLGKSRLYKSLRALLPR